MPVAPRTSTSTFPFDSVSAASKLAARHSDWTKEQIASKVDDIKAKVKQVTDERRAIAEAVRVTEDKEAAANMTRFTELVGGHRVTVFWINDDPRRHKTPRSRCVVAVWDKEGGTVTYGATIHTRDRPNDILSRYQKPAHLVRAAERLRDAPNTFAIDHAPRKADIHRALTQYGCQSRVAVDAAGGGGGAGGD